ncbi:hypothetical protein Lal_00035345, partial [Lupinus albus]
MPYGDLLMVRRLLVLSNVCSLIIDGGSCANVVSTRMVNKLNLVTRTHPSPYRLQWLSEVGEMNVNLQAEVPFSIGKYVDTV